MKKVLAVVAGIVAMSVACAVAQDAPKTEKKHAKAGGGDMPAAKEMTLTGTISKIEHKNKAGESMALFVLKTDDGTEVRLPKDAEAQVKDLVDAQVKVVGMGWEREHNGKKMVGLKTITSVEKIAAGAAAPAAVPAAPVAPAPAK